MGVTCVPRATWGPGRGAALQGTALGPGVWALPRAQPRLGQDGGRDGGRDAPGSASGWDPDVARTPSVALALEPQECMRKCNGKGEKGQMGL